MKKKVIIAGYIIIILIILRLITEMPYMLWYNYGNSLYNKGDYKGAMSAYEIALNLFPSKYKECKIRINMALSMLKMINQDYDIASRINVLNIAREVLTDEGCANKYDDNGHSEEAEKLKKDIDREIAELEQFTNSSDSDAEEKRENSKESNKEQSTQNKESEAKLNKLEQIQKQSVVDRNKELESVLQLQNSNIFYEGKNW